MPIWKKKTLISRKKINPNNVLFTCLEGIGWKLVFPPQRTSWITLAGILTTSQKITSTEVIILNKWVNILTKGVWHQWNFHSPQKLTLVAIFLHYTPSSHNAKKKKFNLMIFREITGNLKYFRFAKILHLMLLFGGIFKLGVAKLMGWMTSLYWTLSHNSKMAISWKCPRPMYWWWTFCWQISMCCSPLSLKSKVSWSPRDTKSLEKNREINGGFHEKKFCWTLSLCRNSMHFLY